MKLESLPIIRLNTELLSAPWNMRWVCQATEVEIKSDSELIVNQMNGSYRVKKAELKPLYEEAKRLVRFNQKF